MDRGISSLPYSERSRNISPPCPPITTRRTLLPRYARERISPLASSRKYRHSLKPHQACHNRQGATSITRSTESTVSCPPSAIAISAGHAITSTNTPPLIGHSFDYCSPMFCHFSYAAHRRLLVFSLPRTRRSSERVGRPGAVKPREVNRGTASRGNSGVEAGRGIGSPRRIE